MDWATQPDPFRRYPGADLVRLLLPKPSRPLPCWQLYMLGEVLSEPLSLESISLFFRYALSLTAWKRFHEMTWALRANPSSGNLHPTEGYAVLPTIDGLGGALAVYHYAPKEHALERRAILDAQAWSESVRRFLQVPPRGPLVGPLAEKPGSTVSARSAIATRCWACTRKPRMAARVNRATRSMPEARGSFALSRECRDITGSHDSPHPG